MWRKRRIFIVALAAALWLAGAPANSQNNIGLTAEVKARIMALEPLRGNGVIGTAFDGRPGPHGRTYLSLGQLEKAVNPRLND